jgi:hypothetical protein
VAFGNKFEVVSDKLNCSLHLEIVLLSPNDRMGSYTRSFVMSMVHLIFCVIPRELTN